jgi:hypothetical protein
LTTDAAFVPTGDGPAGSPQGTSIGDPTATAVINATPTGTSTAVPGISPTSTATTTTVDDSNGPAAYWQFEESSGPIYFDSIGTSHSSGCFNEGCPASVAGQIGNGQAFDGNNSGLNIPAADIINWAADDSFTLGFWMKAVAGSTCATDNEVMLGRDDESSGLHWWIGCRGGDGQSRFSLYDQNDNGVSLNGPVITDGDWHQIVAVRNGTSGTTSFYVDGARVATADHNHLADFSSETAELNIGWLDLGAGFRYEGALDEMVIYGRALDHNEIVQHYQNGLQGQVWEEVPVTPTAVPTIVVSNQNNQVLLPLIIRP